MRFLILSIVTMFIAHNAYADRGEFIFTLAAVANNTIDKIENDKEDKEYNVGVALLFEANVNSYIGIETGGILIDRQYDAKAGSVRLVEDVKRLHIPVLVRFWPADFISIAAGPYASLKVGNTKRKVEIGDTASASLKTSAKEDTQLGLDAAVTLNFAVFNKTGIFVEGRYSSPFEKEKNETSDEATGLVGLKVSM